jgi:6-hydroxytryprostatin B O-methyltransferase
MILHDWPAPDARKILVNHISALKASGPSSRLLIMDTVLPPPGSGSIVEEALLRMRDLTMIQTFNSKERELGEFVELFESAVDVDDHGNQLGRLVLKNVVTPPGSFMSVMEVAYEEFVPRKVAAGGAASELKTAGTVVTMLEKGIEA